MAYDTYQAHEWQHGEVITSQRLNTLEQAVENGSTVTKYLNELEYDENLKPENVEDDGSFDAVHGTTNNKIATQKSVERNINDAIDLLDVESLSVYNSNTQISNVDNTTYENETGYQRIITQISQENGKISSLKYKTLPIATKFGANQDVNGGTLGLVRVGNDLTITPQGGLSGDYKIDSLSGFQSAPDVSYNNNPNAAGYNPLTTVQSVDYRIRRIVEDAPSLGTVQDNPAPASLTITGISQKINGHFQLDRLPISIPIEQVNDIHITGNKNANGQDNEGKYTIPTLSTVNTAIVTAINNLDVDNETSGEGTHITGFGAGKTLSALTESNGKIGATFQDISIIKSQVSDLETLRSLTSEEIEDRDDAIEGNEEWVDPRESEGLLSTSDYDTFIELVQPMESWDGSGTDTRPAGGLITPTDKDRLDALYAITTMESQTTTPDDRANYGYISKTDKDNLDTLFAKNSLLAVMESQQGTGTDTRPASGLIAREDKTKLDTLYAKNNTLDTLLDNITIDSNGKIVGIKIYNTEGTAYKTLTYSGLVEPEPEPQPGE